MLLARLVCFWSQLSSSFLIWSILKHRHESQDIWSILEASFLTPIRQSLIWKWCPVRQSCIPTALQETSSPTISQPSHSKLLECNAAAACTVPAKDGVQRWRACAIDPFSPELWETASQLVFVSPCTSYMSFAQLKVKSKMGARLSRVHRGSSFCIFFLTDSYSFKDIKSRVSCDQRRVHFLRMEIYERKWPSPRRVPPAKQLGPLSRCNFTFEVFAFASVKILFQSTLTRARNIYCKSISLSEYTKWWWPECLSFFPFFRFLVSAPLRSCKKYLLLDRAKCTSWDTWSGWPHNQIMYPCHPL